MIIRLKEPKDSQVVSDFEGTRDVRYEWLAVGIKVRQARLCTSKSTIESMDGRYLGNEVIVPYGNIMYVIMDDSGEVEEVEE